MRKGVRIAVVGPDGVRYKSMAACARAFECHPSVVAHHMNKHGNLKRLGSGKVPCVCRGVSYPSLDACARALGVARHTLNHHLDVHGHLEYAGIGKGKGNPGNRGNRRPITIGPLSFPRRKDAADEFGISTATLRKFTSPNATTEQVEKLMALTMQAVKRRELKEKNRIVAEARRQRISARKDRIVT